MITVITCFWNAGPFIEKCISSLKAQTHKDFQVYLINDVSTDDTVERLTRLTQQDSRFNLINNPFKMFKIQGMDTVLRNPLLVDNEDIIVELDGDDWLANPEVLSFISLKYNDNPELWLTNGSFIKDDGEQGFSAYTDYRKARSIPFTFSHLRTWKGHLWRQIKPEDLKDFSGQYFSSAVDLAYSFPLIEMAGLNHYEFIDKVLYVYNTSTPYNEFKEGSPGGGRFHQMRCEMEIRGKKPYEPLD